jgi:hypothetical protein
MKDDYVYPRGNAPGMELRDWFAGMIVQGTVAGLHGYSNLANMAIAAYSLADSMMDIRQLSDDEIDKFLDDKIAEKEQTND